MDPREKKLSLLSESYISTLIPENVSLWSFRHDSKTNPTLVEQIQNYFFIEPIQKLKSYDFLIRGNLLLKNDGNILMRNINASSFLPIYESFHLSNDLKGPNFIRCDNIFFTVR